MQIRITADDAAHWMANQYIDLVAPGMAPRRKNVMIRIEKFNMIARGFSCSTVFLLIGVVSLFFSLGTALFYLGSGAILRKTMGDELDAQRNTPGEVRQLTDVPAWVRGTACWLRAPSPEEQDRNIFRRVVVDQPPNWNQTKSTLHLCGADFWQSTIPWPTGEV